jgi:hypothetical protein
MLAEVGRRADFALTPATDVVHEGRPRHCAASTTDRQGVVCGGRAGEAPSRKLGLGLPTCGR